MSLKLNDFMAEVRALGVQKANRFRFEMDPPPALQLGGRGLLALAGDFMETGRSRQIMLRCQSANFPGVHLMTKDDIQRYGMGPIDHAVHGAMFGDISAMFIVDGKGLIQDFFHKWQRAAVNFDSSEGMEEETRGATPYEVSYKDDYVSTIMLTQLDERDKKVVKLTAQKVFPAHVGDLSFAWDANDQVQVLPVTFAYRDHKLKNY